MLTRSNKIYFNRTRTIKLIGILFVFLNGVLIYKSSKVKRSYLPVQEETDSLRIREKTNFLHIPEKTIRSDKLSNHRYKVSYLLEPKLSFNRKCDKECSIKRDESYKMVTFIKSKASNTKIRNFLRRTWTSIKYTRNGILMYVFVVGLPKSNETLDLIEKESKYHKDILMIDEEDSYKNIARKTLASMQWASENLPSSYLYSSGDDDMMIDVAALDDNIMKIINTKSHLPCFPFICIFKMTSKWVFRDPKSKYYVPFDEYPDTYWPRGCNGGFYTTNVAMVTKIWGRANEERIIRMDDIWITGILRKKCGIPDSCVAGALYKADLHTRGFRDAKGEPQSEGFMRDEWLKLSEEINKRPHCIRCKD